MEITITVFTDRLDPEQCAHLYLALRHISNAEVRRQMIYNQGVALCGKKDFDELVSAVDQS